MPSGLDAGYRALAGFFYQILASAAHAFQALTPSIANGTQAEVEVEFALERHGQDADTVTDDGSTKTLTLYQYKYSSDPLTYPIEKPELFKILDAFQKSESWAKDQGFDSVRFRLITNRTLHQNAKKLEADAKADLPNNELDEPDTKDKNGKTVTVRSKPKKVTQKRILKELKVDYEFDIDEAEALLKNRAAALGVPDGEFGKRLNAVIGFLFDKVSSSFRELTIDVLNEQLSGFSNARCLTDKAVRKQIVQKLAPFGEDSGIKKPLARRPVVDEISRLLYHSLVIVVGHGGVGKTTAVFEVIERLLSATDSPPPFAMISSALDVDEYWLGKEVSSWRKSTEPAHLHEGVEAALQRLEVASNSVVLDSPVHPIVLLVLDAIDEVEKGTERRAKLRELLRFFADLERSRQNEAARATLVLTCRNRGELDDLNLGGWEQPPLTEAVVQVLPFDHYELSDAANAAQLPESVVERILHHASARRAPSPSAAEAIDEPVHKAICHPAIWHCFQELGSEAQQHAALNGEQSGLDELAKRFVRWFCQKACRRIQEDKDDVRMILHGVARNSDDATRMWDRGRHWTLPASQAVGEVAARRVWREAVSAGVISDDDVPAGKWRWKHGFVYEYLRNNDFDVVPGET